MVPIPPDAALTINGSIMTCMKKRAGQQHQVIKPAPHVETISHHILPTSYDNIGQIVPIDEALMSFPDQLPSSTI